MKRCPQCYSVYPNTDAYCEVDGQRLLDDPALVVRRDELVPDAPPSKGSHGVLAIGFIGLLSGVILCCAAYLVYPFLTAGADQKTQSERPSLAAQVQEPHTRPAPARVSEALPSPSESPAEEEATQASPVPSQAPAEPVAARFNNGPVSTGDQSSSNADGAKARTIIELTDGSKVEVDAAWKDNQGVWYRQGSLVSFVEGPRVKSISARAEPKSSPAANQ